jgi:hypothetical protein
MNSPLKPSQLSPQELNDFLHRLSTESKKVVALFADAKVVCSVCGTARVLEGFLLVSPKLDAGIVETSSFRVALAQLHAVPCAFMDPREFKNGPFAAFFETEVRFVFCICCFLPQGGFLCLAEMEG